MQDKKFFWEVDEIDLNLRHYSGHPIDVIKRIKYNIEEYLSNPKVDTKKREIYSAIYNSLDLYMNVSNMPSPGGLSNEETFLSYSIKNFNNDYNYLSSKYDSKNPNDPPVIYLSARIKSPLSFVEKVKEKITTYLEKNRDLRYFNESLRDLIGLRIIVDPPKHIKDQGLEAESNFLYEVYYYLMNYHGINNQNQTNLQMHEYKFIPVNTRYEPNKLSKIKQRPSLGFSEIITSGKSVIYIPQNRPDIIDSRHIDSILKDFNKWPKFSGYQSLHTCVVPHYSYYIEKSKRPSFIIPSFSDDDFVIEYQVRTFKQHDYAEYGGASHKFSYKPDEASYHRLAVPSFITSDDPKYHFNTFTPATKDLKLRTFGESYEKFYGHSFNERFNITFKDLINKFGIEDINAILADKKYVKYDKENDRYYLEDAKTPLFLTNTEIRGLGNISTEPIEELAKLFDSCGATDSIISTSTNTDNSSAAIASNSSISIYTITENELYAEKINEYVPSDNSNVKGNANDSNLYNSHNSR